MGHPSRKANRRFWGLALTLVLLTAAAALAVSLLVKQFNSHSPTDYEPKDGARGLYLDRKLNIPRE